MKPFYVTKLVVITTILLACNMKLHAQSTTYSTPGGPYTYTVPAGVTAVGVDMAAGQGGNSGSSSPGGKGGRIVAALNVTPGQVLYVSVGGVGTVGSGSCTSKAGGANGGGNGYGYGGGGGGYSDIRSSSTFLQANEILIAGAGGGAGYDCASTTEVGGAGGGSGAAGNGAYCSGSFYNYYCGTGANGATAGTSALYEGGTGAAGQGANANTSYCYAGGGGGGYAGGGCGAYGGGGGGSSWPQTSTGNVTSLTHTQGFQSGAGYVIICAPNLGTILGNSPVCPGSTLTLSTTGTGGTWSISNPAIATINSLGVVSGIATGTATVTYAATIAGCGSGFVTAVVTVNTLPAAILGTNSACVGNTSTLSNAGVGTWSTSDPSKATVNTSGVVTGIASGTPNISFTLTSSGCTVSVPFTVFSLPAAIVGATAVCAGGATTPMGDASPGGTWTSSNTAIATVTGGSGIVTGGTAGVATITYTLPTGCLATRPINVTALPSPITGSTNVCTGSNTILSDAGGGTWSSSNVSVASVGPTGIVSGVGAGTATITYTLSTGCSITSSMLVNPIPAPITGLLNVCAGDPTTLGDASPGGTWGCSVPAMAVIVPSSGAVTTLTSGTPTISYTLPTGCVTTALLTINALPSAFAVTGGGGYCAGTGGVHIGLGLSTTGVNYKLYNGPTLVNTLGGSNSALDFGLYTTSGTYTVVAVNATTGCTSNMTGSTTVSSNPLPNTFNVTGGGNFCPGGAGANVYQSGSDIGINYQLSVSGTPTGAALAGTGAALDFGPQTAPGIFTVTAINPGTGCSRPMVGTATITLNALPPIHTISSGGSFCTGGTGIAIILDGSDASTTYQLFYGSTMIGSTVAGTGLPLNFGVHTAAGTYTIVATNTVTTCTSNMSGIATIAINPLPLVYMVTGGGSYCPGGAGVHVNLNYSNTGVNYQLYRGSSPILGALIAGSDAGLDFGLQTVAGTYSVVAIDASSSCSSNMSGSVNVSINSLPAPHSVTGGGNYCAGSVGLHVGLNGTNVGTRYQLFYSSAPIGTSINGTGAAIDFGVQSSIGSYTVVATNNATSCTANMTGAALIGVNPLPNIDTLIGAGSSYCAGGTGIDIMLNNSDMGVNYQLYRGGSAVGAPYAGTGSSIDFGLRTAAGIYTVSAIDATTSCASSMYGNASVTINPAPGIYLVTGGGSFCSGGTGVHVGLGGSTLGVNYTVTGPGGIIGSFPGSGSSMDFGLLTAGGAYTVTAADGITSCSSNMSGSAIVNVNALPDPYTVTGSGSYCAGASGISVNLSSSTTGIHYQLYNGSTPVGAYHNGTGGSINFGLHTAGTYTVIATNPATSCSSTMASSAVIIANSLPVAQTITGGGAYCASGAGSDISLAGSTTGVNYQLIYLGSSLGAAMSGTGTSIDFGSYLGAGTYTVVATDTSTLCNATMPGSASISITPQPTVETVTGGGAYCAGGAGMAIGLGATNSGIHYQLMNGALAVGGLLTGTGAPLSFGVISASGTYTVVASPGGLCQTNMTGSATITISPLPAIHNVTGGGSYCANDSGRLVGLNSTNTGINYQLYRSGFAVGSATAGTGSALNFGLETTVGLYTVVATDVVTGCTSNMAGSAAVSVLPVPNVYNVAGGGPYCAGGNGVHIYITNSNTNVSYQLYRGATIVGSTMAGTGTAIDFGLQTAIGTYTISGTDNATACTSNMADTATVSINPIVTPVLTVAAHPGLSISMGQPDTLVATVTNGGTAGATYQWKINHFPISGATNSTFVSNQFANNDTVTCEATSTGMCGGITTTKYVVLTVRNTVYVAPVVAGTSDVKVMPNPNKGIFTVAGTIGTNNDEEVSIEVLDVVGHVIYTRKAMSHNGSINEQVQLGAVANGMYLLNLRSNTMNQVFHIVVEQ